MQGAREYAKIINAARSIQRDYRDRKNLFVGRLLIQVGHHARGHTLCIKVIDHAAAERLKTKPPEMDPFVFLDSSDTVEVYGVTGGQPGWTETYGWLHEGPWQADFMRYIADCEKLIEERLAAQTDTEARRQAKQAAREQEILAGY